MLKICDITIDSEFEALIPLLSDDERTQLVANIERDGFRDPLVAWMDQSVLLDGHNRFRIWQERFQNDENREPEIAELKFATREDAMTWIIQNQLGRRNLTDAQRVQIALRLKPMFEAKAKANQKSSGGAVGKNSSEPVRTMAEVAKVAGVSEPTARQVETVLRDGSDSVKSDMLAGKLKINAAHKTTKPATKAKSAKPPKEDARTSFDTGAMDAEIKNLKDSLGHAVSNGSSGVFRHVTTYTSLIGELGKIVGKVEALSMGPAGLYLNYDDFRTLIKNAQTALRFAKPYCPCPPLDFAKDKEQAARWKARGYMVEMDYRQLTDKQKATLK